MIQEMAKSQKSVMEREREDLVVVFFFITLFCSVVGIRELLKGPLELFNVECFGRKRCYLLLAIMNDKETRIK